MTTAQPVDYQRAAKGLVARWEHDPERFFREALHVKPWAKQIQIAESVDRNDRTAVRSSQKIGKSAIDAWIAVWWAFTRKGGQVVLTAPAAHQVENILWPEVRRVMLPDPTNPLKPRLIQPDWLAIDPRTGLRLPGERRVFCVTTNEPEKLAGLSGKNLLFIVDEGSGYPDELWSPIFGNLAGGGKLLTTGNPTQTSGAFYEAFHEKSEFWETFHVSSYDTPNVIEGREVIPGLATRDWCEERLKEWGEDSIDYQVRVLGNFPKQGSNAVVALSLYDAAKDRWFESELWEGDMDIGVDVARFGDDDSVIALRFGRAAWIEDQLAGYDSNQVAGAIADIIKRKRGGAGRVRIKVDVIGYGSGVVDRLNAMNEAGDLGANVEVYPVNVSETALDESKYHSLRDELWFGTVLWLPTARLKHDPEMKSELVGARYAFDERGRRKVEAKKEMKKRIGRSPDRADALNLAVHEAPKLDMRVGGLRRRRTGNRGGAWV